MGGGRIKFFIKQGYKVSSLSTFWHFFITILLIGFQGKLLMEVCESLVVTPFLILYATRVHYPHGSMEDFMVCIRKDVW